ncbi:hypothetical protein M2272_005857 [Mycobacterium frederiksbergense]|uniref:Rho termination factor n=1 Tax=Mycolicibacterium frederiksbergense TaxID=117567 RepID=A0ABT6L8F8_9MYCO|nr:hypothetical protein [Mycolicibacterium frederiksbergense]MDH6199189.1 hypothetical protein [Mycolicibacterium frederiksbergense]
MSGHILLASVFYLRQEDGSRKRFRQGDVVTGLSDDQVQRLFKAGALGSKSQPERIEGDTGTVLDGDLRPKHVAPKAEWIDYAVTQGADREGAEDMTKAELIEMYGG